MKFHVKTYGCQMNERDSETVIALLEQHGHVEAGSESEADVVIVNTCSVRGKAEEKAVGKLGLLVAGKRERPGRLVGAIGCMVQRLGADILRQAPGIDFAAGTRGFARLPRILADVARGAGPVVDVGDGRMTPAELRGHAVRKGTVSAFVNILFGCDRGCSYCVVPAVRGSEWSRPGPEIVAEAAALARAGVKEITLLGQSVMAYGARNAVWPPDHASARGFREPLARLLEALNGVEGLARIRFTSGHPSGCTGELTTAMASLPAVCEHLHMPVQSGSDRILGMMGRGYTAADYKRAVAGLRAAMPDIAITTDIITGFPSESAEDFEMTRRLMEEIRFDNSFIFKYSPRPNTAAAEWKDDVPAAEKMRRNKVLLADQDRHALAVNGGMIGRTAEVLVEGRSLRNRSRWSGRTRTNKIVVFEPAKEISPGTILNVRIERATAQTLYGRVA